ncbi:hypothetical protein BJ508DRAFT_321610 [Ascobolus immersus RN42]|uniref:Trypsin-like serine protease n=1 Tax=Ascobolus immersus RN42 TaxID=1160509 RepID=A0A3N4IKT0_ASCIM|nr:hypothetical protein BJ508DRAFT_321610 [Ascobolus immersus RN42]
MHQEASKFWPISSSDPTLLNEYTPKRCQLLQWVEGSGIFTGITLVNVPTGTTTCISDAHLQELREITKLPVTVWESSGFTQLDSSSTWSVLYAGGGTGGVVLVDRDGRRYLLTNHHVVSRQSTAITSDDNVIGFNPSMLVVTREIDYRREDRAEIEAEIKHQSKQKERLIKYKPGSSGGTYIRGLDATIQELEEQVAERTVGIDKMQGFLSGHENAVGTVRYSSGLQTYTVNCQGACESATPQQSLASDSGSVSVSVSEAVSSLSKDSAAAQVDLPVPKDMSGSKSHQYSATLDWALVELNDNISVEDSMAYNRWCLNTDCRNWAEPRFLQIRDRDAFPWATEDSVKGAIPKVRKYGAGSGLTTGRLNGTEKAVKVEGNNDLALEHFVIGDADSPEFSKSADSGSIVVDKRGRVVGLLVGGEQLWKDGRSVRLSFYIPIEKVLGDIERVAGLELRVHCEYGATGGVKDAVDGRC